MEQLKNKIEAILFVSGNAVEKKLICEKLAAEQQQIEQAILELKQQYSGQCGIHLLDFNGKIQFSSNSSLAHYVESVLNPIKEKELTNAMLETLAVIAYKQPITRLDVEDIRGVDCTYSIQNLSRLGLIEAVGRKDAIGKPILFATTDDFLKRFSLSGIHDLPDYDVLLARLKDISEEKNNVEIEKPMFEDVPDFLNGEEVEVID